MEGGGDPAAGRGAVWYTVTTRWHFARHALVMAPHTRTAAASVSACPARCRWGDDEAYAGNLDLRFSASAYVSPERDQQRIRQVGQGLQSRGRAGRCRCAHGGCAAPSSKNFCSSLHRVTLRLSLAALIHLQEAAAAAAPAVDMSPSAVKEYVAGVMQTWLAENPTLPQVGVLFKQQFSRGTSIVGIMSLTSKTFRG